VQGLSAAEKLLLLKLPLLVIIVFEYVKKYILMMYTRLKLLTVRTCFWFNILL